MQMGLKALRKLIMKKSTNHNLLQVLITLLAFSFSRELPAIGFFYGVI